MARGLANGEPINSPAQTREWDEGYTRTFGERKPTRGRWVYDEAQQKLVPVDEYVAPQEEHAINAAILAGRFYENTKAPDGTDIGSRRKHQDYMRANGLATADDFSPGYYAKQQALKKAESRRKVRDALDRKFHEINDRRSKP